MREVCLRGGIMALGVAVTFGSVSPASAADLPPEIAVAPGETPSQRAFSAFVAAGAGFAPEYEGASSYHVVPFAVVDLKWREIELEAAGTQAKLNLAGDGAWAFGPAFSYRGDRDDDVKGPVKRLAKIDAAAEAGGFVGYKFGGDRNGQGQIGLELKVLQDVSGTYDGFTATAGISYAALRWGPIYADLDADVTYASKGFNRTYFGVTQSGSAASGLRAYKPDAGVKDFGAGLTVGYQFTEQWGVLAHAGVTRYVGDAADSPIVKDGARTAGLLGVAVSYRY